MKNKFGVIFMVIGATFLTAALSLFLWNSAESKKAGEVANVILKQILEQDLSGFSDPYDVEMTVKEIDGYGYIGYISIPSKNIVLPVMSEWDYKRLKISPCRYYGSAKTNNLIIAAHNFTSYFGPLLKLKPGDRVVFTDMDGIVRNYVVSNLETLYPSQVDEMKNGDWDLTLFTCTRGSRNRCAIRCDKAE